MKLNYSDFYGSLIRSEKFATIKAGIVEGNLYDIMVGKRPYSYVLGSGFAANNFNHDQDPMIIVRVLHWLAGEGTVSSSDVERCIAKMLSEQPKFLLGMDYVCEYLERYRGDPWFPEHYLNIDCRRLVESIPRSVLADLSSGQLHYIRHFNEIHSELAIDTQEGE